MALIYLSHTGQTCYLGHLQQCKQPLLTAGFVDAHSQLLVLKAGLNVLEAGRSWLTCWTAKEQLMPAPFKVLPCSYSRRTDGPIPCRCNLDVTSISSTHKLCPFNYMCFGHCICSVHASAVFMHLPCTHICHVHVSAMFTHLPCSHICHVHASAIITHLPCTNKVEENQQE